MMFDESSYAHAIGARKTSYPIHDYIRWVNRVCVGTARWVRKKGAGRLLLEQEVHGMRDELLIAREDMLCLGVGSSSFEVVYAELHYLVGVQNGPRQVHLWKARSYWENSLVAGSIVGIWYRLCHSEGDKRERLGRLSSSTTHKQLLAYASRIP